MKKGIPIRVVMSILILSFVFFVLLYEGHSHNKMQIKVEEHARIISGALWNMDPKGANEYLAAVAMHNDYECAHVADEEGEMFIGANSKDLTDIEVLLMNWKLTSRVHISTDVFFNDKVIGNINVIWRKKTVYLYSYILLVGGLILAVLQLYNRVLRAKNTLEHKVEERTMDLSRINEELSISEDKFSKAFRSSPTLISICTLEEGRYLEVNDAFINLSGYKRDEVIGHTYSELSLWPDPSSCKNMIDQLQEQGAVYNQELGFRIKSGGILTVLLSAEMIEMENEPCILAVALDITDRKKLENQLLHSQKLESVGTLAGGIAHDFNNILTTISGFARVLNKDNIDEKSRKRYINQILKASNNATNLAGSLLTFSRNQKINLQFANLNEIIKKQGTFLTRMIREDIEFRTILSEDDLNVMVDYGQIEQVLMNLVTNARDAMPEGGVLTIQTASATLDSETVKSLGYGTPGSYALVSVSDTGSGIENKTKEKIFEPFFTTKEVNRGTGLGLSIVYGIVKQHNGFINVNSSPGEGSTFMIYLPLTKHRAPDTSTHESEISVPVGGTETILVAEDDEMVRDLIISVVEEFGYRAISAKDGEDAVNKFMENKDSIQLIISDVIMPKNKRQGGIR